MTLVPLGSLSKEQLAGLATLHFVTMPTLLTDLGFPLVYRYYQNALDDSRTICFVAQSADGQSLSGWVLGSPHPSELAARLQDSFGWFALQMMRVAFTQPRALLELAKGVLWPAQENLIEAGEIELTYIGVAPDARGQGLGSSLLERFLVSAHQQGYTRVTLSVETDNHDAIRLYQKAGFVITKTFKEGRFERHRMSLSLKSQGVQEDTK